MIIVAIIVEDDSEECGSEQSKSGYEEKHEVGVVIDPNAVVDPRAVMVKAFDADVTDAAVARAVSSDDFTIGAE